MLNVDNVNYLGVPLLYLTWSIGGENNFLIDV